MFSQRFVLFCYKINPKIPLFFLPLNPAFSVAPSNLVAVAALHYGGLQASKVKMYSHTCLVVHHVSFISKTRVFVNLLCLKFNSAFYEK